MRASHQDAPATTTVHHDLAEIILECSKVDCLQGVKQITTGLDSALVELRTEFEKQAQLCQAFRKLATEYRPIRNRGVACVVQLKDYADNAFEVHLPLFLEMLQEGEVDGARECVAELRTNLTAVKVQVEHLRDEHNAITERARRFADETADQAQKAQQKVKYLQGTQVGAVVVSCAAMGGSLYDVSITRADLGLKYGSPMGKLWFISLWSWLVL